MHSKEPSCPWVDGTAHMKPHSSTILELTCMKVVIHGERTTPCIACRTYEITRGGGWGGVRGQQDKTALCVD